MGNRGRARFQEYLIRMEKGLHHMCQEANQPPSQMTSGRGKKGL